MLWTALESAKASEAAKERAALKKKDEFESLLSELNQKLNEARALSEEKEKSLQQLRTDSESKIRGLEKQLADERRVASERLSAEQKARQEADEAKRLAEEATKRAEEDAARKVEELVQNAARQAEEAAKEAVEQFKDSPAFWDPVFSCYDQGMYHMVRCHLRASGAMIMPPKLDRLADWATEDQFENSLKIFHPLIPFTDAEIAEYNGLLAKEGRPPWVPPPVKEVNLRQLHIEAVKRKAAEDEESARRLENREASGGSDPAT